MADSTNATIDQKLVDVDLTEPTGLDERLAAKYDTLEGLRGLGARDFPSHLWIEPRDWQDAARANDQYQTWPEDFRTHYTHQGNSHECVTHAFSQVFEIAWNRQRQSTESAVWFSPMSIYPEANPRRWGGTYLQRVLSIAMERGVLPEHDGPEGPGTQRDKFAVTMHQTSGRSSSGPWVPLERFPAGWRQTARHFKPLEVVNPASWEEIVCLILQGYAVSVGRRGHSIPYTRVVWQNGKLLAEFPDSYEVTRYDSTANIRAGVGGAYAIVTTTLPDDWEDPAGDD